MPSKVIAEGVEVQKLDSCLKNKKSFFSMNLKRYEKIILIIA